METNMNHHSLKEVTDRQTAEAGGTARQRYPFVETWSTVGSVVIGGDGFKIIECKCPGDAASIVDRRNKEMQAVMLQWPKKS